MPTNNVPQKRSRFQFLERYGAVILRGGIATTPNALYRYQAKLKLSPQHVWFIAAILAKKWDADLPHPSLRRMAQETGVSLRQLQTYKKELIDAALLVNVNRTTTQGGQAPSGYDFSPLLQQLEQFISQDHPSTSEDSADDVADTEPETVESKEPIDRSPSPAVFAPPPMPAQTPMQPTAQTPMQPTASLKEAGNTEPTSEAPLTTFSRHPLPRDLSPSKFESAHAQKNTERKDFDEDAETLPEPRGKARRSFEAIGSMLSRSTLARYHQLVPPAAAAATIQGREGPPQQAAARRTPHRSEPEIALRQAMRPYLEQFAEELGDEAPLSSTMTQAVHLYERSHLTIDGFLYQLQQAHRETQRRSGSIQKRRVRGGPGPMKNKMPFYFAVLRDYLGLKELPPLPAAAAASSKSSMEQPPAEKPRRRTIGGPMMRIVSPHRDEAGTAPRDALFSTLSASSDGSGGPG